MSYTQVKAAFIAKALSLTDMFPHSWQVSDDIANKDRGAEYFIFTIPSSFAAARVDAHHKSMTWIIIFDFLVRYKTQKGSFAKFETARDTLIDHFHSDPLLLKTPGVSDVLISAGGELAQDAPGNNPNYLMQTMTAAIVQRVKFEF